MKTLNDDTLPTKYKPTRKPKVHEVTQDGLRLKVYPSGVRTFGYMAANPNGHNQFHPLGQHGAGKDRAPGTLTLAEAYAKMTGARMATKAKREQRAIGPGPAATLTSETTFAELLAEYDEKEISVRDCSELRKTRWRYVIKAHFLAHKIDKGAGTWGEMRVGDFNTPECIKAYTYHLRKLQTQKARGGDRKGKCTLSAITDRMVHGLFDYAVMSKLMHVADVPPRLKGLHKERAITRYLSVQEIENLLRATTVDAVETSCAIEPTKKGKGEPIERMKEYDASFLRLLLLTGTRLNSLRLARRSLMHTNKKGFWTFPSDDLKQTSAQLETPTDHLVPITKLLKHELARIDETTSEYDFLFPERYAGAREEIGPRSSGWAKHLIKKRRKLLGNVGPKPYTAHAIRRTMSNYMRLLDVPKEVIDVCAARVAKGTDKTYQNAEMPHQVRDAFETWHAFVHACMHGKGDAWLEHVRAASRRSLEKETADRCRDVGVPALKAV